MDSTVAATVAEGRGDALKMGVRVHRAVARACTPNADKPDRLPGTSYLDERDFDLRSRYVRLTK